jgi:MFS family permease
MNLTEEKFFLSGNPEPLNNRQCFYSWVSLTSFFASKMLWEVIRNAKGEAYPKRPYPAKGTLKNYPLKHCIFVALLAVFNAGGRVLAGALSDKIGRIRTIFIVSVGQVAMMFLFSGASTITGFVVGSAIIEICYGPCLSLFPSACGDYWGTKNLGLNYGILCTALRHRRNLRAHFGGKDCR